MLDDHRSPRNAALEGRRDAYRHPSATSVRYGDRSSQLRDVRANDAEGQGRWSFSSQQATLPRLAKAFDGFFRRIKVGRTPGCPRFEGASRFGTVEFPTDGDGCRWNSTPGDRQGRMRLQGVGHVRVHQHHAVRGRARTVGVEREGDRWFVVLSCDDVPAEPPPATGSDVGVDMGAAHFAITGSEQRIADPRRGRRVADELAAARQRLATSPKRKRARDRTEAHREAARKVAKRRGKVQRQHRDHHHKTVLELVRSYDTIAHENLNVAGMARAPEPKPDTDQPGAFLPNQASAKAGSNRSILDAGRGQFLGALLGKAERTDRRMIPMAARNTSRTCPSADCGHVAQENRVSAWFVCQRCGYTANADVVGAANIAFRAGLVLRSAA